MATMLALVTSIATWAQAPGAQQLVPNLESNIERPLRYRPDSGDFVIDNGAETFNRPLYGRNTAFRVDGGDKPEFVLYLPGRGGNLRLGLRDGDRALWLQDAEQVRTRYRPGELLYEIRDPLLGVNGTLHLQVLAMHETDGLVLRARYAPGPAARKDLELIAAFGGVNGQRGARDGDIGTERVPISQWFQLQPEFCADNTFTLRADGFELHSATATIAGVFPSDARLELRDASRWGSIAELLASKADATHRVAVARVRLRTGESRHIALQRIGNAAAAELDTYRDVTAGSAAAPASAALAPRFSPRELRQVFERAREHFSALRAQVEVHTPDPYVDAAVGALNVATDAVWDETQQVVMHGAIAWRARLLGWRGAYAVDALGWHDRARRHFEYWVTRQNLEPVPTTIPPAEEATHLARNPAAIHSNGDLSNSHYDMNLVYIDALFRHLLWTGDRDFAKRVWPVIERHLAWERRLFRREFGEQKLPLYEAYAAIWASDDLQYHGGGVTHATAYNWWHNVMAARVARWLGQDASPYDKEAELIGRAMEQYLWLPEQGMFAEYRDYLGLQLAHPSAALWSFYHVLDAHGLVTLPRAWQMTRWVENNLPQLPVRGPGIEGRHHLFATSSWMPYTWSINNVVMGENMHAALGFWQAGRADQAFQLFRSGLLASMFMGISPGNVGTMNYLDVYRRESQRDFADGGGTLSRALVEGLFGVRPDALAGDLWFEPGWPAEWQHASLRTPGVGIQFRRDENRDRYRLNVNIPAIQRAHLRIPMRAAQAKVTSGPRRLEPAFTRDALGREWLEISWPVQGPQELVVEWIGPQTARTTTVAALPAAPEARAIYSRDAREAGRSEPVDLAPIFNDRVTEIFRPGKYRSPRSPFASLAQPAQGIGAWAGHVNASADIDDSGLRRVAAEQGGKLTLPDGVTLAIPTSAATRNVAFASQWDNYPRQVNVTLQGRAKRLVLLMAGSTNHMQSRLDNGEVIVEYVDGTQSRLALHNPSNWWPIEQDYFLDDFQFRRPEEIPMRVDLKTGRVRQEHPEDFKGKGALIPGGAATVLELRLDAGKELKSLRVHALANEVVIGLMAATLIR